jgi:hypothetical protein
LLLEVGYIGNQGRHLTGPDITLNEVPADRLTAGNTQLVRPFPQFSNVTWINPSIGRSSYHGVFFRAQKRFSDSFSVLGHYTWSRYLDDIGASAAADDYGSGAGSYQDAYNRQADWARSGDDVPHRFVLTVLYEVPTFSRNRIVDGALSHWRIGVLQTAQSGPVFTVTSASNLTNAFPAGAVRPNLIGDPELSSNQQTLTHWFNTAAFVNPGPLTFGNSPRSVLRGPAFSTTDVTLEKAIVLSDRHSIDVRVEAYNFLNRTNFNPPGSVLGAADFGVISSARSARTVQLGARFSF